MNDAKFRLEARRLIRCKIADRSERMAAVDALIDIYVDANGMKPDDEVIGELTDYILREELTDACVSKVSRDSYPILSDNQLRRRRRGAHGGNLSGEISLDYIAELSSSNVDIVFYDTEELRRKHQLDAEVKRYRQINREQPVITYNLIDQMGEEAFRKAYPITPRLYTSFRGEQHVDWSLDVRRRDGFTCQKCGVVNAKGMHAHHIESYNVAIDLRFDVNNGITLCNKCHCEFHATYGYGYNTRKQLDEWMGEHYYEF